MKRSAWRYLWKSEDIRKKILITLLLLAIFRLAANIPVPGINTAVIASVFQQSGAAGTLLNLLDLLAGGTMSKFSILAMGVYPYITAQIILQLLMPIIPALERKFKDNPREGRQWMERWTIIGTIPMALLSAVGQINIFNSMAATSNVSIFTFTDGWNLPTFAVVATMVAGTMFGVWIGQLISEFGIPNQGLSLVIFAGIVSRIPANLVGLLSDKTYWWLIFVVLAILVLTIFAIVFVTQGRRNVPVMFPGRRMGARMSMPVKSSLPLMVNMAGMIPLIFAQSLLTFPAIIASFLYNSKTEWLAKLAQGVYNTFSGEGVIYAVLYFLMVVAFTFFYTDVLFTQQNYGDNLKKQGARIMGVVPGEPTQRYLTKVQRRITLPGALFLGLIAVLPYILNAVLPAAARQAGLFLISAAGLLIVVGVVRDTFTIIETELKLHGYDESLIRG
ncbi:MAG TPA: preprotein translocase subunit SecY [Anaerolineaceae bacterium]|nr:preprotein translocase subunit SecY [Anaerolineaceae bacterium]HQH86211.1 preprotein translocase subunit SecY [Anaerolineaceae bacterium]